MIVWSTTWGQINWTEWQITYTHEEIVRLLMIDNLDWELCGQLIILFFMKNTWFCTYAGVKAGNGITVNNYC